MIAESYQNYVQFYENFQTVFQSICTILYSTSKEWEFLFLHILIGVAHVLDIGHSDR